LKTLCQADQGKGLYQDQKVEHWPTKDYEHPVPWKFIKSYNCLMDQGFLQSVKPCNMGVQFMKSYNCLMDQGFLQGVKPCNMGVQSVEPVNAAWIRRYIINCLSAELCN
jgi:hypothetical protein